MRNDIFLKMRVSEIRVNQIRVNQGLGVYFFRNLAPNSLVISKVLEPVCCKKQQKKVLDQLLCCRIGDL